MLSIFVIAYLNNIIIYFCIYDQNCQNKESLFRPVGLWILKNTSVAQQID